MATTKGKTTTTNKAQVFKGKGGTVVNPTTAQGPKLAVTNYNKYPKGTVTAHVWVMANGMRVANGGNMPARSAMVQACHAAGIAYNTAQTQVGRYMAWYAWHCNGAKGNPPYRAPRGAVLANLPTPKK